MREIQIPCAHCGTLQGAKIRSLVPYEPRSASTFVTCNGCLKGIVVYFRMDRGVETYRLGQDILGEYPADYVLPLASCVDLAPKATPPRAVASLPESAAKAFRDSEEELARKKFRSAVGSCRTALERGFRHKFPDLEAQLTDNGTKRVSLNNRIQAIAKQQLIPPGLVDLAHHVRAFGNEIHEDEDPDEAQAALASECTHLLLLYLFELPAKVAAAQERLKGE